MSNFNAALIPLDAHGTFFYDARVGLLSTVIDHQVGSLNLHNRTLFGAYQKMYQNFVPGAVNADETRVSLSAYNNATRRRNLFNQTDLTYAAKTGTIRHTLLAGAEFGQQRSNNFRNTGFFNNRTTSVQTGSQSTQGFELGLSGNVTHHWRIMGGYAYQDAAVTAATTVAPKGARTAQVPRNTFSLWNNYWFLNKWSVGLGILGRSSMYAAIDDKVIFPGYTRADAALQYAITEKLGLQANLENVFDKKYFVNADGNDNISPGFPRVVRVSLTWKF